MSEKPSSGRRSQLATPAPMPATTRERMLLASLLVVCPAAAFAWPFAAALSIVPFVGFVALPSLLGLTVLLFYGLAWLACLLLAQDDSPARHTAEGRVNRRLYLPWSPARCWRIDRAAIRWAVELVRLGVVPDLLGDWCYRRVMMLGGQSQSIVREGISYGAKASNLLDAYLPPKSSMANGPVPVLVFVPGGGRFFGKRSYYAQVALRLRKLGFVVLVLDTTQYPHGRCRDQVSDLRAALEWTARECGAFGGDPKKIYLFGHGAGAHLSLLAVVQEAVVRSRDEWWLRAYEQNPNIDDASIELAAGIQRLEIWGESFEMPQLRGLILMAPIVDVIKHCKAEARAGIEHISPLRRSLGQTHRDCLMSSPSHLLYCSTQILDPERLPERTLIIHGGQDRDVAVAHSVLLKNLLVGVGAKTVRLRAYREMSHLEGLTALARSGQSAKRSRYAGLVTSELASFCKAED